MTGLHKTTAVKLRAIGKERDLRQITPDHFLELTPKQIREITEVHMGNIGLEKIRGFEKLKNLECVWLNNNKLKYINNMDANFRIKTFMAQYNEISSLKGSLNSMHFLETLDLSHNKLRDLEKLLTYLERFNFLRTLNLKGNPCCEEPDYRLHVIHKIPSVHVLDQHVVTQQERYDANTQIGGDIASLTIGFGKRIPMPDEWILAKVEPCSAMEKQCNAEAEKLRQARAKAAQEADFKDFERDPHPLRKLTGSATMHPPPGWKQPQQTMPSEGAPGSGRKTGRAEYRLKDKLQLYTLGKGEIPAAGLHGLSGNGQVESWQTGSLGGSRKLMEHHTQQIERSRPTVVKLTEFIL
mmetsp:Transcript_37638/g.106336  ORF Transcript_37638/g.106336 Transcript_37638/m.106336 type:complete len:353 (-) Transcript_37638:149-1207(-)